MKFISNTFNSQTQETTVEIADKYNKYIGKAKLHPDDKEFYSFVFGGTLAEYRAWLMYYKYHLRRAKIQLEAIKNLQKDIINNNIPLDKKLEKRFNLKIRDYNNKIAYNKNLISILNKTIKQYIEYKNNITQKRTKKDNNN